MPLTPHWCRPSLQLACRTETTAARWAALRVAERAKARTYPELASGRRCRLVVLGIEVGGRWSPEAAEFVRLLARSKARAAPPAACTAAFVFRWFVLLAFAAARTFAASLLSFPFPCPPPRMLTETYRSSATSWLTLPSSLPLPCCVTALLGHFRCGRPIPALGPPGSALGGRHEVSALQGPPHIKTYMKSQKRSKGCCLQSSDLR